MRILIVEDDAAVVRLLERSLRAYGYEVVSTGSGEEAIQLVSTGSIDLVLLDIALPGIDGHQVLARIRAIDRMLPVLMLTARDDTRSKVSALDSGADDYLTKPFDLEELLVRIRALIRRRGRPQLPQPSSALLQAGDLVVDPLSHRAWRGDESLDLSAREFALLAHFMRHPGQALSREQILSAVWGYDFDPESNIVDVYVRYLRRKLDRPGEPSVITTIRGVGYRFDPPSQAKPANRPWLTARHVQ